MQINGTVSKRQQVDACGEMVDGWQIDMTVTYSTATSSTPPQNRSMIVATQLGALPIAEHIKATDAVSTVDIQYTIGQVRPDPLPADSTAP